MVLLKVWKRKGKEGNDNLDGEKESKRRTQSFGRRQVNFHMLSFFPFLLFFSSSFVFQFILSERNLRQIDIIIKRYGVIIILEAGNWEEDEEKRE